MCYHTINVIELETNQRRKTVRACRRQHLPSPPSKEEQSLNNVHSTGITAKQSGTSDHTHSYSQTVAKQMINLLVNDWKCYTPSLAVPICWEWDDLRSVVFVYSVTCSPGPPAQYSVPRAPWWANCPQHTVIAALCQVIHCLISAKTIP